MWHQRTSRASSCQCCPRPNTASTTRSRACARAAAVGVRTHVRRRPPTAPPRAAGTFLGEPCIFSSFALETSTGVLRYRILGFSLEGAILYLIFCADNGMKPLHSTVHPGTCGGMDRPRRKASSRCSRSASRRARCTDPAPPRARRSRPSHLAMPTPRTCPCSTMTIRPPRASRRTRRSTLDPPRHSTAVARPSCPARASAVAPRARSRRPPAIGARRARRRRQRRQWPV